MSAPPASIAATDMTVPASSHRRRRWRSAGQWESRDHVRLRYCAEAPANAVGGEPGWTAARLATTCRDLLTMLKRHLAAEETLLTTARAARPMPATEVVTGRSHAWYPLTEGAVAMRVIRRPAS